MDVPTWQLYLGKHPELASTGAKVTAALSASQAAQLQTVEDSFHAAQLAANQRDEDWHGEWSMWKGLDIGTRLVLYVVAYRSIEGSDNWNEWGAMASVLPFELQPAIGRSVSTDKNSFFSAQGHLHDLAGIYDALVTRAKTGESPMTWQDYLAAHPDLSAIGRQWTMTMNDSEKAEFESLEQYMLENVGPMNGPFTAATAKAWNDWTAGNYSGLRLLYYASAADSGVNNPQSVSAIFPGSIAQPKNPTLAQGWLAWMQRFADLRDRVKKRAVGVALTTSTTGATPGTGAGGNGASLGNNLSDLPATHTGGSSSASSSGLGGTALWIGLLVLGILAMSDE